MQQIQEYGAWRAAIADALDTYRGALQAAELADAAALARIGQAQARVRDDRLSIAFVAEFSRGKSELINAIFFADYGQRILPSAAGRTTMCPTELLYDAAFDPCIRLLPIETRASTLSTGDYRDDPAAWTVLPLDLGDPERMRDAFRQVSLTRRVPAEEAQRYGLYDPQDPEHADACAADGTVEIPQWRHALINLPHPLLKQGLVILDTPGLNAIGTEPELTLNLIPNAHAVLFVLAAETGVTRSDIEVWRTHIGAGSGRIVVLNKIDAMWDPLKNEADNEAELARQRQDVARQLGLEVGQVYPVSAQQALVGRIQGDMDLFERSRVGALETALLQGLVPQKKAILSRQLREDLAALETALAGALAARMRDLVEQLQELKSLRGKNQAVLSLMMRRIEAERKDFDAGLLRLQDARTRFAALSTQLYSLLGLDAVQRQAEAVRLALQAARFATGMRAPVRTFFDEARAALDAAEAKVGEIGATTEAMVRGFAAEHGLTLSAPPGLSLARYRAEIDAIEALYAKQFGTATLLMTSRATLMERFFDSIASRVRRTFRAANGDVEAWLKVIMAPLETQIRQHKEQLRHRLASIQRIHDATDSLEQKIAAFEARQDELQRQRRAVLDLGAAVGAALDEPALLEAA
ncbi:dynamin family protein [Massilia sp.]|uniref:dynamin family protein n=1 Tax=Massilia sp. TaxID=1882437 RepID=UPI0028ACE3E1|nr:dynamin family protein [Massilia sp.]